MPDYIFIVLAFALLGFILARKFTLSTNKNIKNLSAKEAYEFIKTTKGVLIIDVRTKQEYQSGHISGARSIPVAEFAARIKELNKYKDSPILVHCASGGRSPAAVRILAKNNFSQIYHMNHGLKGWEFGLK
jgi:rhodanese-related sulfurtransferase